MVHVAGVDAALAEQLLGAGHQAERSAQIPLVDLVDRHERREDGLEPLAVEPAVEELDVLGLAESTVMSWKRPGKRFLRSSSSSRNMIETRAPVAEEQRRPRARLLLERRRRAARSRA